MDFASDGGGMGEGRHDHALANGKKIGEGRRRKNHTIQILALRGTGHRRGQWLAGRLQLHAAVQVHRQARPGHRGAEVTCSAARQLARGCRSRHALRKNRPRETFPAARQVRPPCRRSGSAAGAASSTASRAKPNIVFILMDNLGYGEVGCYGGGILRGAPTPRIDELAAEGMRLLNFNVEAQCTPSRSALMTGRFAIRSGTHSVPIGGGRRWPDAMGGHARRAAVGPGYATGALRQVAPRQRRRPAAQRSGLRRVVRHPAHDRRGASGLDAAASTRRSCTSTSWKAARAREPRASRSTTSSSAG